MYIASHSVICQCLVKQHSRNDKKKKKKKKKDCRMSVHHKADPGELIQWVTHESRSSAASNSGLIRIGPQPRTADAWHHDSCRPRGVVTRDFSAIFDRLFDRLPVRISTSDLHHWILWKKIFHIRAYDFGVQFSFKRRVCTEYIELMLTSAISGRTNSIWTQNDSSESALPQLALVRNWLCPVTCRWELFVIVHSGGHCCHFFFL